MTMEFSSDHVQTIVQLLALLVIISSVLKLASQASKKKRDAKERLRPVPEPPGALPLIGHLHLLRGQDQEPVARILGGLADRFGSLFSLRLGHQHRLLVVSSAEMVKECLATNDKIFATRANLAVGKYLGYNNAIFALAPYGQYWRDVRKISIQELLSNHAVEMRKPLRSSEVESLIKDVHSLATNNKVVNISDRLEEMAFNIILKVLVGKRFSSGEYAEKNSEANLIRSGIKEALYLSGVFVLSDAIPYLEWMDFQGHVSSMKQTAKKIDSVLEVWLAEHLRQKRERESTDGDHQSDLMDAMLSSLPEDAVISGHTRDTIIRATTMILILTGAGSTAVALTWALSLLLNNPTVLKAAQEEIDIHVGKDKWVQESDIKNLNYLQAIVKETLRVNPAGPVTGIREAMEDCTLGGYHVSKGTRMIINIWKLHRDPRVWPNATEFRPERFMKTSHHDHADSSMSSDANVLGQQFEYAPFSYGRRSCPGGNFGLQVVCLALARLLQGFEMTTMGDMKVDMREGLGLALPKADPLQLVLKPRLRMELY
ncbi:dimethylnonatriene synthase-like [Juglans regia]|uniref:Dimethylnonatriene synthase-like n=2 Tax=Juglans regia TaxID=51240 RepID=A0A2I4GJV9_JUGRE|nr:dimethylnonatriene synthase-like [Juglans regia]